MSPPSSSPSDPLLPPPPPTHHILLLPFPRRRRHLSLSVILLSLISLAFISFIIFLLYPSDPTISVVRLRLTKLHISPKPPITLTISLSVKLRVRNVDFFALEYRELEVAVGYRGRNLGVVESEGGRVRARAVSYVDAEVTLDGVEVLHDVWYLVEDLVKGVVELDTVTEVKGVLHFLVFDIPIKGKISCGVHVNPANQTIVRQDCYPE